MPTTPSFLPGPTAVEPTVRSLATGATLFRKGDPALAIFRVLSGKLRLTRITETGVEVPVHSALAGELLAEAALFSEHYHCDAIAAAPSVVEVFPKAEIVRRLKGDPERMWEFAADMAHRLQGLRTGLELRQVRSAQQRVLQALRLRADRDGRWKPDGTLKQFAEEIGLTHEALYRALAALEASGCIAREREAIRLLLTGPQ